MEARRGGARRENGLVVAPASDQNSSVSPDGAAMARLRGCIASPSPEHGILIAQGDPGEVLAKYRAYISAAIRAGAEGAVAPLLPSFRRGDGRAQLESIELLNAHGQPVTAWLSGEQAVIAVNRSEEHTSELQSH